jgi:tetratricopeptide repeat protein
VSDATELTIEGQAAMQAGRYEDAVRAYTRALALAPKSDGLLFQLASALVWRGLPTEALPALDQCAGLAGPWSRHAAELALRIRGQTGLPVHGMMILPVGSVPAAARPAAQPSPMTTLSGMPASKRNR